MKVLILSSNQETVNQISFFLRLQRVDTATVSCNEDSRSIEATITETPNLIIAERFLPGLSYAGLVRQIRELSDVPLIVLIDESTEMNRAEVIEAGADECIVKPFSSTDLLAKANALLRRTGWCGFKGYQRPYASSPMKINFARRQVFVAGKPAELTPTEYSLLSQLVKRCGKVVTYRTLLENTWRPEYAANLRVLKVHMCRLRKKLEHGNDNQRMILSLRGLGYKFNGSSDYDYSQVV